MGPQIICTKVYGPNEVFAKSQFWKINKEQHKLKRASGEVLRVSEVHERNTKSVSNYGIWFHYRDRTAFRNAFKEDRRSEESLFKSSSAALWEAKILEPETQDVADS